MSTTEIYTYNRKELEKNSVIVSKNEINDIIYITEKNLAQIYYPNTNNIAGQISYINDFIKSPKNSFNTSIGTIITPRGSLVFNFNYLLKYEDSEPIENLLLRAKPTFLSGVYSMYKNLEINVQIVQSNGDRILSIEYN